MIKTISLKNISQAYAERPVLDGVGFTFTQLQKICVVGDNGAGKSTLLRIIAGEIEPDAGAIDKNAHIRCQYVAQEFDPSDQDLTIHQYIEKHAGISLVKKAGTLADALGFPLKGGDKVCRLLSGGQQKILALSTAIAAQPDFLLLDEPENHLDIVSRLELIGMLQESKSGILFISHDRLMIDALADSVAEVSRGKVYLSEGGYEDYIESRLGRIEGLARAYDVETKRIKRLEETVVILGQKAFRGKETAAYHRYKDELEELKAKHKESGRPDDSRTRINLRGGNTSLHSGKLLCRVDKAGFAYPEAHKHTFKNVNLELRTGSHVVLLGRNGSGKSTFLRCLVGKLPLSEGTVTWTPGLKVAYFDQHTVFDASRTPLDIIMKELASDKEGARAALGGMKFTTEEMDTALENLSGGQRMRLRFALVFNSKPDFLLLDEPTNHLDEVTWQILLDACNASKSTILLVTHDHEFIEGLESKLFWVLQGGSIHERHKSLPELIEELRA